MNTRQRRSSLLLAGLIFVVLAGSLLPRLPRVLASPAAPGSGDPDRPPAAARATQLSIGARATETGVLFELDGVAPPGATEALLWYDTEQGRRVRRLQVRPGAPLERSVAVSFVEEGLVVAMPFGGRLDYWWALRGDEGPIWREAGALFLPPRLRALARPAAPALPRRFTWSEAGSEHFRFRFYPGSAAERDIEQIKRVAEQALIRASALIPPTETVSITTYLVPRIFWQGGAAYDGSNLLVSYTDRNYTGIELSLYMQHESVHALAHGLVKEGGDVGGLIGEGIAVYATGGHYGPEPIDAWTAALRRNGRFVPLCPLRVTFFEQQHEIAYLEGASFVGYLIRTFGLEAFRTFYAEEPPIPDDAHEDVEGFCAREATRPTAGIGKTYAELEAGWMRYLDEQNPTPQEQAGVEGQLRFFDLMRQYQESHDPVARTLPPPPGRWNAELLGAFAASAVTETNSLYETLFIAADRALDAADPAAANGLMDELDIAVSTGVFTGTTGRQVAEIGSLLRRTARDYRLGESEGVDLGPEPSDPSPNPSQGAPAAGRGALTPLPVPRVPCPEGARCDRGRGPGLDPLWTEYRLVLNSVELEPGGARARVERLARPLDGLARREGLIVTLSRGVFEWRIESAVPDPRRPAITPPPARREPLRVALALERLASTRRWEQGKG